MLDAQQLGKARQLAKDRLLRQNKQREDVKRRNLQAKERKQKIDEDRKNTTLLLATRRQALNSSNSRPGKTVQRSLTKLKSQPSGSKNSKSKITPILRGARNSKDETIGAKGERGERNAGIQKNTTRIPSASGKKAYRIPDAMNKTQRHLKEVKNVNKQGLTSQIKDFAAHATRGGSKGRVDIIVDKRTKISKPLQTAHDNPRSPINIIRKDLNK